MNIAQILEFLISHELFLAVICIILVYQTSHVARYYIKFTVFISGTLLGTALLIPICLCRPRDIRNGIMFAWIHKQHSKLIGLKWDIRGKENIDHNSGCVVLLNHQSHLDTIAVAEIRPFLSNGIMIMKKAIQYWGTYGLCAWLCGIVFVDRSNSETSQAAINKTEEFIRVKKAKVTLFPEGTKYRGTSLKQFKKGAFHLAIATQTPIQPAVISAYHFLDDKKKIFNAGTTIISFLPPIPTAGLTKDDVPRLMAETWQIMNSTYERISHEAASTAKYQPVFILNKVNSEPEL